MKKLQFLPLGGAGEIGMNLNLYGDGDQWVIVDMGVSCGDDVFSSIDVTMPNPEFLIQNKDKIKALILTHAHEDHIGAIPHLWPELKCPIYATAFTAEMIKHKLAEVGIFEPNIPLHVIPLEGEFTIGDFAFEYVTLTHSIPEANAILIKTPVGNIFHTGDWKFDHDPVIGKGPDIEKLKQIGDEGVLALVGDSTNAPNEGRSGSEAEVSKNLPELFEDCSGRIVITSFASNLARFKTICEIAQQHGRKIVLAGKSFKRLQAIGSKCGLLENLGPFYIEEDIKHIPRDKLVIICTGSQGEPRAALTRAAKGVHPRMKLDKGDRVIFSSKRIPGNESTIAQLYNNLYRKGIEVITDGDHYVHVSGHPRQDELREMFDYIRPKYCVPVHGELYHMQAHAKIASEKDIESKIIENGLMLEFKEDGEVKIVDEVFTGKLVLDGKRLIPREHSIIQTRRRMSYNGFIALTCVLDKNGFLASHPQVIAPGVFDEVEDEDILINIESVAEDVLEKNSGQGLKENQLEEKLRQNIKKILHKEGIEKPFMEIQFIYI